jgi:hypothetical protein
LNESKENTNRLVEAQDAFLPPKRYILRVDDLIKMWNPESHFECAKKDSIIMERFVGLIWTFVRSSDDFLIGQGRVILQEFHLELQKL